MRTQFLMGILLAAIAVSGARAQSASPQSCLVVNNASSTPNKIISVLVDGYGEHFWAIAPNTTVTLTNGDGGPNLHGASFRLRIYNGVQGSRGQLLDTVTAGFTGQSYGTSETSRTLLTYVTPSVADPRAHPECRVSGFWVALFHD